MSEDWRTVDLAHTTILRSVEHYTPEFAEAMEAVCSHCGRTRRMDETYIRVRGEWMYLCRAVDKAGNPRFHLSRKRDVNAATAFLNCTANR